MFPNQEEGYFTHTSWRVVTFTSIMCTQASPFVREHTEEAINQFDTHSPTLDISRRELYGEDVTRLAAALSGNQVLTELNLASNNLSYNLANGNSIQSMNGIIAIVNIITHVRTLTKLDVSGNQLFRFSQRCDTYALTNALKATSTLHELNLANNYLGRNLTDNVDDAKVLFADGLGTNPTLKSLDISDNEIGRMMPPSPLPEGWTFNGYLHPTWVERRYCYNRTHYGSTCPGAKPLGADILAKSLKHNRTLTRLYIRNNLLATREAGHALADALKANSTLKILDVSQNTWTCNSGWPKGDGRGFFEALAIGIAYNETLTCLNIGDNGLLNRQSGKALARALNANSVLKELNLSNNYNRYNDESADGYGFADELAKVLHRHRTLTCLNISNNNLGELILPPGWTEEVDEDGYGDECMTYTHIDGRHQEKNPGHPRGVTAIAAVIFKMCALNTLIIGGNHLVGTEAGATLGHAMSAHTALTKFDLSSDNDTSDAEFTMTVHLCALPKELILRIQSYV